MARPVFTSSIWWRCPPDISPVTFDHDDLFELPPFGEASSLFSYPVTAMQDHCCNLASRMGFPALPLLSAAAELFVVNLTLVQISFCATTVELCYGLR
jgi:hypothetical protein